MRSQFEPARGHHRNRRGLSRFIGLAIATVVAVAPGRANPVPDRYAQEMNECPSRWLAKPNREDERKLVSQFANYGISRGLLSPATIRLLEKNFDRFAPVLVAAQLPPNFPHSSLQRWYREHADRSQADAMKAALRSWLTAKVTKSPIRYGERYDDPEMVQREILEARVAAADALGDWGDEKALPDLRALRTHAGRRSPVIVAAIRRIEDPDRADILVRSGDGRIIQLRPRAELDSMTVSWRDAVSSRWGTWVADPRGVDRIWAALAVTYEVDGIHRPTPEAEGSFMIDKLKLHFWDGRVASLERGDGSWMLEDNGRFDHRLEVLNRQLGDALFEEMERAGVAPSLPRFARESVTLIIHPGKLEVIGIYEFEGKPQDGWFSLRYPIAREAGLGPPRVERVTLGSREERRALKAHWEQKGDELRIGLETGGARTYELEVSYTQPLSERSAKYLVTTAREWARPLHQAWFQVIMDSTMGEPRFDWAFREAPERPGLRRYLYQAIPFRPEKDLVVRW